MTTYDIARHKAAESTQQNFTSATSTSYNTNLAQYFELVCLHKWHLIDKNLTGWTDRETELK